MERRSEQDTKKHIVLFLVVLFACKMEKPAAAAAAAAKEKDWIEVLNTIHVVLFVSYWVFAVLRRVFAHPLWLVRIHTTSSKRFVLGINHLCLDEVLQGGLVGLGYFESESRVGLSVVCQDKTNAERLVGEPHARLSQILRVDVVRVETPVPYLFHFMLWHQLNREDALAMAHQHEE